MRLVESIGLALLVGLIGFFGGCAQGKSTAKAERLSLAAEVEEGNVNLDACTATLRAIQAQNQESIAKAEENVEAVAKAVEDLARENMHLGDALSNAQRDLVLAGEEPTCREQLEMPLCSAVPLL